MYVKLIACARPSASLSIWVTKVTSPHEYSLGKVRSILMAPTLADSRTEGDFIFCIHHQQCRQGIKARRRVGAEWGVGGGGVGGRGREGKTSVKNKLGDISDNNKHILKHRAVDKTTPVCTEGRDWELSELPSSRGGYAARFLIKSRLESAGRHQRGYTRLGVTHDSAARCKLASVWPPGGDPLR